MASLAFRRFKLRLLNNYQRKQLLTWNSQNNTYLNGTGKKSALLKCPNPRFPFLYLASWSWTFWHWDISHVIWCELQSVTSSQIKPPWHPYCRYCFFYRNSTCEMFWKKIGKKNYFCHPPQKGFFSRFLHLHDFTRFLYLASWSWTFWHWDISHVIWCELQSVTSSQIKPPWHPYCRYCFFYRNSTCEMFWKKIGKKNSFCHPPQKGFFSRFLQSSSLKLTSSWFPSLYLMLWMYQGLRFFVCISRVSSVLFCFYFHHWHLGCLKYLHESVIRDASYVNKVCRTISFHSNDHPVKSMFHLTIIPRGRVGYEMIDSQRGG